MYNGLFFSCWWYSLGHPRTTHADYIYCHRRRHGDIDSLSLSFFFLHIAINISRKALKIPMDDYYNG